MGQVGMIKREFSARKGLVTSFIAASVAIGSGHLMQTVLSPQEQGSDAIPTFPVAPEEARVPIVLRTPPPPRLPERFG